MQEGIASSIPRIKNIIKANQRAIEAARQHRIPVIFIRLVLDKHLMMSPRVIKCFQQLKLKDMRLLKQMHLHEYLKT